MSQNTKQILLQGLVLAFTIKGDQTKDKSKELIREHNIMQIFIKNTGQLRNYKKITGTGIIHFNNPQQLLNRLELLAGSIFAGNNGVKQEFSQIAHLLHQLKVIKKKQLNDLLKKYILFKLNKIMERAIDIFSINREKTGENRPDNFLIKFNPTLKLDREMQHSLAIDRLTMTYSWYNIRSSYNNNTIKYTNDRGANWNTVTFKDGMYSYTDINDYLHQYMEKQNHHTTDQGGSKVFHININFILSTYRVLISFSDDKFQLDLRGTDFGELIRFDKKLVTKTEYGTKLPNITNSIDVLNINTTAIKDSIVDGVNTNTLAMIPTDNLIRSYPFTFEPRRTLYCTVSSNNISEMRFYVTDSLGRPVDLNGIDWFMTLILHSR